MSPELRARELLGDYYDEDLDCLASGRTNVFHLPVRGSGDGGAYTTLDDVDRFWAAFGDRFERISGGDAGVRFLSIRGRYTVISNSTTGARDVVAALDSL